MRAGVVAIGADAGRRRLRRAGLPAGPFTIAATNDSDSPLASVADALLPLSAGEERAIAATKTYTAQVAALALLAAHLAGEGPRFSDALQATAAALAEWLPLAAPSVDALATRLAAVERMLVLGRGPEFATARELALKLLETCRVAAEPLTATDLAHGPVAALDSKFPVWAIADHDATLPTVAEAVLRARAAGATVITSGPAAEAVEGASISLPVPTPPLPLLAPLLSIVAGQLFAWALARGRASTPTIPPASSRSRSSRRAAGRAQAPGRRRRAPSWRTRLGHPRQTRPPRAVAQVKQQASPKRS